MCIWGWHAQYLWDYYYMLYAAVQGALPSHKNPKLVGTVSIVWVPKRSWPMSLSYVDEKTSSDNPLELLVEIVGANDWAYYLLSQIFVIVAFFFVWKLSNEIFEVNDKPIMSSYEESNEKVDSLVA